MDRALYLAMSGAKQDMQAMQLRANNLANVSTTGFRADLEQSRSMQAYGEGLPSRVFNMTERPGYSFEQGSTITTGRNLDVAVQGEGWMSVLDSQGQEGYTRAGWWIELNSFAQITKTFSKIKMGYLSPKNLAPYFQRMQV